VALPDAFRPPLWREPWVFLTILFACAAGLFFWFYDWQQRAQAEAPEIVYGTIEGGGTSYSRHGGRALKLRVRLEDGRLRSVDYALQDLRGCKRGGVVVLEKRRSGLTLAAKPCPFAGGETGAPN
jgi:hypothetical protein